MKALFIGFLAFIIIIPLSIIFIATGASASSHFCGTPLRVGDTVTDEEYGNYELTEERFENAKIIAAIGAANDVPPEGQAIAIATAMVESVLINLDGGDRDSLGLFQQRPSMAWGTAEQISDPEFASESFYFGRGSNKGLMDLDDWISKPWGEMAQTVQISGHPNRYQDRMSEAQRIQKGVSGATGDSCVSTGAATGNLVTITMGDGSQTRVDSSIAVGVQRLAADLKARGHILGGGGWRSAAGQIATRKNNCGTSEYAIYEMPSSQCSPPTARPGTSQHEIGLAMDFTCNGNLITTRVSNPCYQYIATYWPRYFEEWKNLASEPWHWSTTGR